MTIPPQPRRRRKYEWTPQEDELLRMQIQRGTPREQISVNGRTPCAILHHIWQLKLDVRHPLQRWSARELRLITVLGKQRLTATHIKACGFFPTRTTGSVKSKLAELGLVSALRSDRAKYCPRLSPRQQEQFCEYLRRWVGRKSTATIAKTWGVSISKVFRQRHALSLQFTPQQARTLPAYRRNRRAAEQLSRECMLAIGSARRAALQQHLETLARRYRRRHRNGDAVERFCQRCQRQWPVTDSFFRVVRKRKASGLRRYLRRICRLCPSTTGPSWGLAGRGAGHRA